MPMLKAREALLAHERELDRKVVSEARGNAVCRLFMTSPGVGPITALTFMSGVDNPARFAKSRDVGVHFGLTPRLCTSPARFGALGGSASAATPWCARCCSRRRRAC